MTKVKVVPPNGKPKSIEKKKSTPRNNFHLTKEELEVMIPALDGVAFTANVTNFAEVSRMIKLIEKLKDKLKKEFNASH